MRETSKTYLQEQGFLWQDQEKVFSMFLEKVKNYTFTVHSDSVVHCPAYLFLSIQYMLLGLMQYRTGIPNPDSWRPPSTTHFTCLFCMKHPFQVFKSILMNWSESDGFDCVERTDRETHKTLRLTGKLKSGYDQFEKINEYVPFLTFLLFLPRQQYHL